ncbi:glycoside hydrolase family 29 protein [Bipolaris victoriae FI3]|uniref:alpha-L-fucosidase n=1 Tax=Bipolaris victoriae (strain FI3) TaxID=930091 RepID=W7E0V3_BIPV3|nr:glycoside hydrolase family 29 protein [Bipolaris victoriae FI3]
MSHYLPIRHFGIIVSLLPHLSVFAVPSEYDAAPRLEKRATPSSIGIDAATLTSKWFEGSDKVQIIEMILTNHDTAESFTKAEDLTITASSSYFDLVKPARITRLIAGQQVVAQIGIKNKEGFAPGDSCSGTITANWVGGRTTSKNITGSCGFGDYTATKASLNKHWTPDWYNNAKFGIFIHWGVYSVPAFGNVGDKEDYAEWYWMRMTQPNYKSQTYQHHRDTYGENFNYDDFIPSFTGDKFNAKEWVDLMAEAGARYIVPVTKHHEGFAIFDVPKSTSLRSSVQLGPKRDFLAELMNAAKTYHPDIRRGTYFSMPEWFNPDYSKYATDCCGGFPGGPPKNPYTGVEVPYTGHVPVADYVTDLQLPQMETLAYDSRYETEIMWCDIGGANNATIMLSRWLNWARDQGRQVTYNNRCGYGSTDHGDASGGDFTTPEYVTNGNTVVSKWETNRGMDPFSFGYNKDTPDTGYLTGVDIIKTLVDVISKNGNFLLDIGPMANGTIPLIMQKGLKDAGKWIKERSESIYDTRFWQTTSGKGSFRYTISDSAFYIHVLDKPSLTLLIPDAIPFLNGDSVQVLGGGMSGTKVPATKNENGTVVLQLDDAIISSDRYVWTFKVIYKS